MNRKPSANCCFFAYVSVSQKRNIKRNPNGMKPSGGSFLEQTQSRRLGVDVKEATRWPRGRRALVYPKNIHEHHETLFPPPQPSIPGRSHLVAFSGTPSEGESIMEGFYINTIASPMMCE